jgi:hypothetical protein
MIALDYFLRDNRTWASGIGRDWGIKAATGVLATRDDLRAAFNDYCCALAGDHGHLSGFGQALGGIRSQAGDGYLLCVTLETSDSFGRPSWAVYGLWCPGTTLETAVASDPVGAARRVLGAENPPSTLALAPSAFSPHQKEAATLTGRLRRFDARYNIAEVVTILRGAVRRNGPLPDILGITASSRLTDLRSRFQVVYSHPLDDGAERAFQRERAVLDSADVSPAAPKDKRWPPRAVAASIGWATATATTITALFVVTTGERPAWTMRDRAAVTSVLTASRFKKIEALDPDELRRTAGYTILTREAVLAEHEADRRRIRESYASLIEIRDRTLRSPAEGDSKTRSPESDQRDRDLAADAACRVIRNAFGFEFDRMDSTVRRWCDSLAEPKNHNGPLTTRDLPSPRKSAARDCKERTT